MTTGLKKQTQQCNHYANHNGALCAVSLLTALLSAEAALKDSLAVLPSTRANILLVVTLMYQSACSPSTAMASL